MKLPPRGAQAENQMAGGARLGLRCDRRGAVAVMTAMLSTVLFGFAALAVDVGYWEVLRNRAQAAADQSALAAAMAMAVGGTQGSGQLSKQALAVAGSMGVVNGANGVTVTENSPPTQGAYAGNASAVEVIVTITARRFLSAAFLSTSPVLSARGVALANGTPTCVLALATGGKGVQSAGNGDINLSGCDLDVNSSANNALFLQGSGNVTAMDVNIVGNYVAGGASRVYASGGSINTSAPATADPYSGYSVSSVVSGYPSPTCTTTISSSGQVTLPNRSPASPYVICGTASHSTWNIPSGTIKPGVYVLDGLGISVGSNVSLTASGVTFIFLQQAWQTGSITYFSIGGGSNVTWSAPSTGGTAGLGFWVDSAAAAGSDTFTGGSTTTLTGAIYAPNDTISYYGNATLKGCTQVVAKYIVLQGGSQLLHNNCTGTGVRDPTGASNAPAVLTE